VRIIDLTPKYHGSYFCCLEDWSGEMKDSGEHKACWYRKYKDKGLRVKLALDENDNVGGMIQYLPIEESFVEGKELFLILCIWVHGYKKGRGNFQGRGMGRALLKAAEEDAEGSGAKGIAAWGVSLPFWMKAAWFRKRGYKKSDKNGISLLMWKSFAEDAMPPAWIRPQKEAPIKAGKVTVSAFINGWCPSQNITYERAKTASALFGDKVLFQSYDTTNPEVFKEWGVSDGVYLDGKAISWGPPLSFEKIEKKIARKVKRL
jgi:GNAT superfamily N-acetyltransferase